MYSKKESSGLSSHPSKDISLIGLGPHSWPRLISVTSLKALSPSAIMLGDRNLIYEFWEDPMQSTTEEKQILFSSGSSYK